MKTLFIEARKKNISFNPQVFASLPDKLHILYSIQFQDLARAIKQHLGSRVLGFEQVLGCSQVNPKAALLLIGSGRFHAINIAFSSKKPVYIYSNDRVTQISQEEIDRYGKHEQAKLAKFLLVDNIGIIGSTKPGQAKNLEKIKKQLQAKYPEKKFYLFLADNINLTELENFKIDLWVNTACPGLALDSLRIINVDQVL